MRHEISRRKLLAAASVIAPAALTACATASKSDPKQSHFVLVHGAWHGAWCWNKVVPMLRAKGHLVTAVDLPARGAPTRSRRCDHPSGFCGERRPSGAGFSAACRVGWTQPGRCNHLDGCRSLSRQNRPPATRLSCPSRSNWPTYWGSVA